MGWKGPGLNWETHPEAHRKSKSTPNQNRLLPVSQYFMIPPSAISSFPLSLLSFSPCLLVQHLGDAPIGGRHRIFFQLLGPDPSKILGKSAPSILTPAGDDSNHFLKMGIGVKET
jgi:hypothetical protein